MLDHYTAFLAQTLTPARLRHSKGVMQTMGELAEVYGLDREQAVIAGLLHDAAKDLTPEQQEQVVQAGNILIHEPCEQDYSLYLHGPVGAYYVRKELEVTDPLILDAIGSHTWCDGYPENFNHPLAWCLRFADILEPYRNWDDKARILREGTPQLRKLAYSGQMKEAALFQSEWVIRFFNENHFPVHPNYYRVLQNPEEICPS
jgi:predicted HD superfamily hydrolase involved in NAD metabolism